MVNPARVLLASDPVAADPVRRRIYEDLLQEDYEIAVETLAEAAGELRTAAARSKRLIVVCASPAEARRSARLEAAERGARAHVRSAALWRLHT